MNTPDEEVQPDSAWQRLRNWRRSRPFWGGLLLALAGLELIAIPLLSVLAHGSVKVVIYIGIGGVFGVLIGGLMLACGLLIWFHPVQRVFYSVAGVLLAIASFVATNLGGFFLGMLLGVIGASLSFGWTPDTARPGGVHRPYRPRRASPSEGLNLVLPGRRARDAALENPGLENPELENPELENAGLEEPGAAETTPGRNGEPGPDQGRDQVTEWGSHTGRAW